MRNKFLLQIATVSILWALAGASVHAQSAATTACKDGTSSTATGRGACSGHGGVQKAAAASSAATAAPQPAAAPAKSKTAAAPAPAAAAPPAVAPAPTAGAAPAGATAKCKDGTYSMAKHHQGACSKHGGVGEWMDAK